MRVSVAERAPREPTISITLLIMIWQRHASERSGTSPRELTISITLPSLMIWRSMRVSVAERAPREHHDINLTLKTLNDLTEHASERSGTSPAGLRYHRTIRIKINTY